MTTEQSTTGGSLTKTFIPTCMSVPVILSPPVPTTTVPFTMCDQGMHNQSGEDLNLVIIQFLVEGDIPSVGSDGMGQGER